MTSDIRHTADMKDVVREILDQVYGQGHLELLDQVCASDYRSHDCLTGDADLVGTREIIRFYRRAFPDLSTECLDLFGERDHVVCRWRFVGTQRGTFLGVPPTGRLCTVEGITISRFSGGKLVEDWSFWDTLGLLQQVGLVDAAELLMERAAGKHAGDEERAAEERAMRPEDRPTV